MSNNDNYGKNEKKKEIHKRNAVKDWDEKHPDLIMIVNQIGLWMYLLQFL